MTAFDNDIDTAASPRVFSQLRAGFAKPSLRCALWQLTNALPAFGCSWLLMPWSLRAGWSYGWTLLLALPTREAGFERYLTAPPGAADLDELFTP